MAKRIISCVLLLLIIAGLTYTGIFGLSIGKIQLPEKLGLFTDGAGIRRGLDLDGGASITFEPVVPEGYTGNVSEEIDNVVGTMRKRLTNLGYTEANVYRIGDIRIGVEIPGISNAEEAISTLGQTAKLEFIDSEGNVVLTGSDIVSAEAGMLSSEAASSQGGGMNYVVNLTISSDAVSKFADATARMAQKASGSNYIAIKLDDATIASPQVSSKIDSDTCQITNLDLESAKEYAAVISAGKLPFALDAIEYRSIGPTLGVGALENSLLAAGIGLLIIAVFMILLYRLPGLVSVVSLVFYVGLVSFIMMIFKINLSLPGIAGIILSIGMAVDANVVIFERIKEELNIGRSVGAAIKAGFKKAIIAVADSNVTTLIAAIVLYLFGAGTIKGFAVTLAIGVIVSMFTAVIITRFLLNSLVVFNIRKPALYGYSEKAAKKEAKVLSLTKAKTPIAIAGAVIIVVGITLGVLSYTVDRFPAGMNLGIDFTGGSELNVSLMRPVTDEDIKTVEELLKNDLGEEAPLVQKIEVPAVDVEALNTTDILLIKTRQNGNEFQKKIISALSEKFSLPYASASEEEKVDAEKITWLLSSDSVGPAAATDLIKSAVLATVISALLMLAYIAIRFDFFSSVAAVVALLHDISMMIILNIIFGVQVNLTFVAAVLTILGYSINATIIIFDRIREHHKKGEGSYDEIVNRGVSQTIKRSLYTSFTTLATIGTLYFLGVPSIKDFAFPIIVGIVCGFFSSVFLSGSVWAILKDKFGKQAKAQKAK